MHLTQIEILFYAMSAAFCWTHLIMPGLKMKYFLWKKRNYQPRFDRLRPLDCMKCMSGWIALLLGLLSGYGVVALLLFIAGIFIGAIAEGAMMRYL